MRLRNEERGITTAVVAVCLVAFIGAAMLTIDAGAQWTTRRAIITGTDASVLDAAQMFNTGVYSPCDASGINAANQHATDVLHQNQSGGIHDLADPSQFEVTLADPSVCGIGGYTPGKVKYTGRLTAQSFFSKFFGFGDTLPIATSTAAWGYITSIGEGLRPMYVCDQSSNYQAYVAYWQALHDSDPYNDAAATAAYNSLWGSDQGSPGDVDPTDGSTPNSINAYGKFPWMSMGYPAGEAEAPPTQKANPNYGKSYISPAADSRFSVVHRVISPDPNSPCGTANGNRGWVDLRGENKNGAASADDLRDWILNGYSGDVSLSPHDCNPNDSDTSEDCGSAPGDKNTLMEALQTITCDRNTPAKDCKYIFPILVVNCVGIMDSEGGTCTQASGSGGENAQYVHEAFLFVVLRGFGKIDSNVSTLAFDYEFVDVQTSGEVSGAPPAGAQTYQTGSQLCGVDRAENHCPF